MISVVTAYYNRKKLFIRTLESMERQYNKIKFEVIAVDDGSDEIERLEDLQDIYPFLRVIRLEKENKWYINSCIPFNIGFSEVKGDKIIIQNPECYHFNPILEYVENNLIDNQYLSFACYSLDKQNTNKDYFFNDNIFFNKLISENNRKCNYDGELGWYNHSLHRPKAYHFCAAITTKDLYDLGGFDERYAKGVGYDDDEFVWRVKRKMKINFVDNYIVLHQNHYTNDKEKESTLKYQIKSEYRRNNRIFEDITKSNHPWKVNYLDSNYFDLNITENKIRNFQIDFNKLINRIVINKNFQKIGLKLFKIYKKYH